MSESKHQSAVVKRFKLKWPHLSGCIIGIPNGAYLQGTKLQRVKQAAKLKAEGLKPGTSDLFIAFPCGGYHGLWVEMKDSGKTKSSVSGDQLEHINLMRDVGYRAEWAAGVDQAMAVIEGYMCLMIEKSGD